MDKRRAERKERKKLAKERKRRLLGAEKCRQGDFWGGGKEVRV